MTAVATPANSGRLEAHHLQKSYGSRKVVHDVSISVQRGEVVGLLGPNGAGKTTSFYMIVGLVRADAGYSWTVKPSSGCRSTNALGWG